MKPEYIIETTLEEARSKQNEYVDLAQALVVNLVRLSEAHQYLQEVVGALAEMEGVLADHEVDLYQALAGSGGGPLASFLDFKEECERLARIPVSIDYHANPSRAQRVLDVDLPQIMQDYKEESIMTYDRIRRIYNKTMRVLAQGD